MAEFFGAKLQTVDGVTIERLQQHVRSQNDTELIPAKIRNVLFCGASRSGKTTCFKVFQDPCYCPTTSTMFSETVDTTFKSFSLRNNKDKSVHSFVLSLIDTPGTFEIRASDTEFEKRSNDEIGKLIVECLNHEVTYLNLIVMFLQVGGAVSSRDVKSIALFMDMFGGSGIPVVLCITHGDEHNEFKRNQIINEIKVYPRLAQYFKITEEHPKPQLEIAFMGCVDYVHKDYHDARQMAEMYTTVDDWRNQFLKRIFAATEGVQLNKTNIFNKRQKEICEMLSGCYKEVSYLAHADPDTAEYKRRLAENKPNMEVLFKNKLILESDKSISKEEVEKFWELILNIKQTAKTLEDSKRKEKAELIFPWSIS